MSQKFSEMSAEAKQELVKALGDKIKEHGIDAKVETYTEVVCDVKGDSIPSRQTLKVEKSLPADQADKAKAFSEAAAPLVKDIEGVDIKVLSKLGAGDMYKTIENIVDCKTMESSSLAHDGQVWLLDFWATWCPPCQKPMAHNQEMLTKREDWAGKVRIIGLSIDKAADVVTKHVQAKGWEKVEHFHRATSDCSEVYSVQGVPHVMLIDQNGKIAFKGHPANRENLEADLDTLAKGEPITGKGTGNEAKKEEGEGEKASGKELDPATIDNEVEDFKRQVAEFQKNEDLQSAAKDMPRSFCVITVNAAFDPNTGKTTHEYINHRVLVGKQESIDKLKAAFKDVKGSFEIREQVQAI